MSRTPKTTVLVDFNTKKKLKRVQDSLNKKYGGMFYQGVIINEGLDLLIKEHDLEIKGG